MYAMLNVWVYVFGEGVGIMTGEKEKNFVSAVLYVNNDRQELVDFVRRLYAQLEKHFLHFELICVDDSSTDGSIEELRKAVAELPDGVVSVVRMSFFQGLELSMNAGVDISIGDFVFEFDTIDKGIPLEDMMPAYNKALTGFDIVAVTPEGVKRTKSKFFYRIFNRYSNKNYSLRTEYFHVISRRALNRCQSISKTIPYRKAVYADCGLKMTAIEHIGRAVPTRYDVRSMDTAVDALILFTSAANKLNTHIMRLFMCICLLVIGYVVFIYLSGQPVAGWTTLMLFMSFGFFSVFLVLGIELKYLSVIIDLVFKNKTYVTESVEKLTR